MIKGHKNLEIYQQAHKMATEIHRMTMKLPSFEGFEKWNQIRRSAKSVFLSNI
jgi:four helix bundle protein